MPLNRCMVLKVPGAKTASMLPTGLTIVPLYHRSLDRVPELPVMTLHYYRRNEGKTLSETRSRNSL